MKVTLGVGRESKVSLFKNKKKKIKYRCLVWLCATKCWLKRRNWQCGVWRPETRFILWIIGLYFQASHFPLLVKLINFSFPRQSADQHRTSLKSLRWPPWVLMLRNGLLMIWSILVFWILLPRQPWPRDWASWQSRAEMLSLRRTTSRWRRGELSPILRTMSCASRLLLAVYILV